jgi:D-serine deaminase-like pyridoxal phosphate-dependent protein
MQEGAMRIDDLETPQAVVDVERLEANIARLQSYLDEHRIANRPHIKTHKIPEIAHMQLAAGAVGVTCQKLGEAEVMAQAGVKDILITFNLLGASRLERLARLCRRARLSVIADSATTARGLSQAMSAAGLTLEVLVE